MSRDNGGSHKFYCTSCDIDVYRSKVCRNKDFNKRLCRGDMIPISAIH